MDATVYNRLKILRVDRGWTHEELATRTGCSRWTVSRIERGDYQPQLELVLLIARTFGVPVEQIFSLEPFPSITEPAVGEHDQ